MNFQQLRSVREAVRRGYNLTEVANALFTSQPGVSRQIRELEDELGVEIFERNGKRLIGLTAPGESMTRIIERILIEVENLKRASSEFTREAEGRLIVATTHTQARYALPKVVSQFKRVFPDVKLRLQQSPPEHIVELLIEGEADIGIATEALNNYPELIAFPGYRWNHLVIAPPGHPLSRLQAVGLADIAQFPLVTYDPGFTGRSHIDEAFAEAGLSPDIVLTALDADVIKTYVEEGLGIGIVASMAFDPARDTWLRSFDASHLFKANTARIAIRRGTYLRGYAYRFIELFAPHLTKAIVDAALAGKPVADDIFKIPFAASHHASVALAHA
jgi:LysR family cys regulon transcriptional activator